MKIVTDIIIYVCIGGAIFALGVWMGTHIMLKETIKIIKEVEKLNEPKK